MYKDRNPADFGKIFKVRILNYKMLKKIKSPGLAAFLNVIIPGVGYLYVGKRTEFGTLLIISTIIAMVSGTGNISVGDIPIGLFLSYFVSLIAFGYDGFKIAKETNGMK